MGTEKTRKKLGMDGPLILRDLPQLQSFEGVSFEVLPRQIKFLLEKRYVRVQVLNDQSVHEVRFELFRRLNAGAIALTPQEVRGVLYRGPFNAALEELSEYPSFRSLIKLKRPDKDNGTYGELALKFFAYLDWQEKFTGAVTDFLNDYMDSRKDDTDVADDVALFTSVSDELMRVVGGPIKRPGVGWTPQNQFEAVMVAAGRLIRSGTTSFSPRPGWLEDRVLVNSSTKGTNTPKALATRIDRSVQLLTGAAPSK